ncbi:hypothetical protein NEF87_004855 [Candidatus Lokiarchaeum ossiferum]|uniref:GIY-YIG domain-containing protein n=1 Tax=Candidatus Lokiarchaeum ossiferum TaxID=2951803 RepID=A0ABY6HYI1_9ARCH|nr:hypothetical protein NEF87_004855 [Candidatus Lokiarchaeum sp. B-35]
MNVSIIHNNEGKVKPWIKFLSGTVSAIAALNLSSTIARVAKKKRFGIIYVMFSIHPKCNSIYVGQTAQPDNYARFSDHINDAKRKGSPEYDYKLSRAIRKYGESTWRILTVDKYLEYLKANGTPHIVINKQLLDKKKVIFRADNKETLSLLEILWIEEFNSYHDGYNSTLGGEGKRLIEGFSISEINHYIDLLERKHMKMQIVPLSTSPKELTKAENPFHEMSYSQFSLKLAYSNFPSDILQRIADLEMWSRFYNNKKKQISLANIIVVEKILGMDHFRSFDYNRKNLDQNLTLDEIRDEFKSKLDITPILETYGIDPSWIPSIKPSCSISLGRIGDIRNSILIDLFENNRQFSKSYLLEKYKSTRHIITSSPIQRGLKRIYNNSIAIICNWDEISLESDEELTFREIAYIKFRFPSISHQLMTEGKKLKRFLGEDLNNAGSGRRELQNYLKISRNHFTYFDEIFSPEISIKFNSKMWENYKRLVFIENILIRTPFISPKELAYLYFGSDFSESERKNISRKLNAIKKMARKNLRLSQLYLNKEISLI